MLSLDHTSSALFFTRRMVLAFASAVFLLGSPLHALAAGESSGASDNQPALKTIVIPVEGVACVVCAESGPI